MPLKPQQVEWLTAAMGRAVTAQERAAFGVVLDLLSKWNTRSGLTNLTDPNEIVVRHFCDSALAARLLWVAPVADGVGGPGGPGGGGGGGVPRGTVAATGGSEPRLVDVGPGGGFPGVVVALLAAGYGAGPVHLTFIEAQARRVSFLKTLLREVGVPGEALHGRLEEDGRVVLDTPRTDPVGPFDVAMSRAVFAPAEWLRRASLGPLARNIVIFAAQEPLPEANRAASLETTLPANAGQRRLGLYIAT